MALALQEANLVRQKATNAAIDANPFVYASLKAFFRYWAVSKGNNNLQFVTFNATDSVAGDGEDHGIDEACQVYFIYAKKLATGTDTWYRLYDDADNDTELIGDVRLEAALLESGDFFVACYPDGMTFADGLVSTFTTTPGDTTTQSSAADAGNGFIIIGANV